MTAMLIIVHVVLGILFIIASLAEEKAHTQQKKLEDDFLGKKYYEVLYGRGSWDCRKY